MQPITEKTIRSSFVNASRQEAKKLALPENFGSLDWDSMEYLGWRDPKMLQRGYLFHTDGNGRTRGILLRPTDTGHKPTNTTMCEMCRDVNIPCAVGMWTTRRAGQSGRDGNTLGTLICSHFECSRNVRIPPPKNPVYPDPMVVVAERIQLLDERIQSFLKRL